MIGKGKSISHGVAALEYDLAKEINGQAVATEIARHELYGCTGAEMVQEMKPYHIDFPNVKNNCLRFEVSPSIEESATFTEMSGIIHLAGRKKMVIDQNRLIRIPDLLKSHLFEFIYDKRNHDVIHHNPVYLDRHDLSGFYGVSSYIMGNDLLYYCLSHTILLSDRCGLSWPLPDRLH